ncbi:MAG: IS66 family transposase [Anaerotignum sp.]|nr:IS66 family transposase [Anaerotignum sp.]
MTEHEELLKLRALVAKMDAQLAEKDQIIDKQTEQLKNQTEQLAKQSEQIEERNERIEKLNIRLENMIQALLHARKKLFGSSTECTKQVEGQLSLSIFETSQELARELAEAQKKIAVKPHTRVARQPGVREEMLAGLPKEIEEYVIPADETCSVCGGDLKIIGKRLIRTEVEFEPAKLKVKQIVQQIAKCTVCGTDKGDNPNCHFQKAAVPTPPLAHSISTPSLVAQVMYQKFALGLPLARQEKDWFRLGLVLPRNDMANWVIRCSEEWLTPVYDRIHEKLMECQVLHMDETRIQCNKEEGKKASSDSFMWVIRSAACEEVKATFFHYSRTRNGDIAMKLLERFQGYLITDAYAGYEKVENVTRSLCWSHCRRYLIESIPLDSRGKEIPGSKGAEGREYINLLFQVEEEIKSLSPEEKKQKRQEASRPILDAFWSWVEATSALHTTNEMLTKALTYATNQKEYLETFMEDGRLPISNNLCEANIKPFATARRAWLFADTPKGAKANAVLYTLVESARLNELDVYTYLKYLLTEMPNNHHPEHPEIIDNYLPWSATLPQECRLNYKNKKCLKL